MSHLELEIQSLYRQRPRNHFVIWSGALLLTLMISSWFIGDFHISDFLTRRIQNRVITNQ